MKKVCYFPMVAIMLLLAFIDAIIKIALCIILPIFAPFVKNTRIYEYAFRWTKYALADWVYKKWDLDSVYY